MILSAEKPYHPGRGRVSVRVPEAKTDAGTDDIPYDLIDDDFIIIEDETGEKPIRRLGVKTPCRRWKWILSMMSWCESMTTLTDWSPGTIIDENRTVVPEEMHEPVKPVVEIRLEPVRPRRVKRRADELTIQIPEKVKKILPGNFKISDIRPIDLLEAEKIAGEDILVLTQDDLIEELDSIDLVPLEDEDQGDPEIRDDSGEEDLLDGSGEPFEDIAENVNLRDELRDEHAGHGEENGPR